MELYTQAVLACTVSYGVWSAICLWKHRSIARRLDIPYVVLPASDLNVPLRYSIIARALYIAPLVENYHSFFLDYLSQRWRWAAGYTWHERFGPVFLTVTPGAMTLNVADPAVAYDILTHGKSFEKPSWLYKLIAAFGENVISTEGGAWTFHRRITAPPFDANVHPVVWQAAKSLASQLKKSWLKSEGYVPVPSEDLATLTLYVISAAGFGMHLRYGEQLSSAHPDSGTGKRLGYQKSLELLTRHIHEIVFFPRSVLHWAPSSTLRLAGAAADEFEEYLTDILNKNVQSSEDAGHSRQNLLEALLDSAEAVDTKIAAENGKKKKRSLIYREIVGNAFGFLFAGHETVGNTLHAAILLLALHPEKQEWFCKRLDAALSEGLQQSDDSGENWEASFRMLSCAICVMYETLRIFPPLPSLPKWTGSQERVISIDGTPRVLPPETYVMVACGALHSAPHLWGADATIGKGFYPERWHIPSCPQAPWPMTSQTEPMSSSLPYAEVRQPIKGSFIPFSGGMRQCLGRKFAEVEFAAVLATLFQGARVELVVRDGESGEAAKARARRAIDRAVISINLDMYEEVPVRWHVR